MTQTLDAFQEDIIEFGNRRGRIIYADPMGARKTATTLSWLQQRDDVARILFVVPGAVVQHWISQAGQWYPELEMHKGRAAAPRRASLLASFGSTPGPHGYVTTYECMKEDEHLLRGKFDTIIFDEGHRLKGRTTAVAKCAYRLTRKVDNIWCVTGTPVLNAPEEIWFYLHLLFSKTFTSFWLWAEEYFIIRLKNYGRRQPVKEIGDFLPGQEAKLRRVLSTVLIQRDLDELYEVEEHPWIEEPEFYPVDVQINALERIHYDKLVKHAWTQLPSGRVIKGDNKLVISTRLKQLASDWGTVDDNLPTGSKVQMAATLVQQLVMAGGPVVVFTEFKETARRLHHELSQDGLRGGLYTSDESAPQKEHAKLAIQMGNADYIIGTYGSMREGTDGLQYGAHQMVLVDLLWVPGLVDQAIGRLRRDGQLHRVKVWLLACRDTIDMTVLRANLRKVNVVNTFKGQDIEDVIYGRTFDIEVEDE